MPDLTIENSYANKLIAGVDEVGRGALAGSVVAAAVIIDQNKLVTGIKDSKKLSKIQREKLYQLITTNYYYAVGIVSAAEIDLFNILEATKKASRLAVAALPVAPDLVLIDGNMQFTEANFISIIKGDDKSLSIAAASIIAKVTRDRIMTELASRYPAYCWQNNVGYGTKTHLEALKKYGISEQHRRSFAPVAKLVNKIGRQ